MSHRKLRRWARRHEALLAACRPLTPEDKAFYTVRFESSGDHPHHDRLYAIVRGKRAHEWADVHCYFDGDTWDACGPEEVYAIAYNVAHAGGSEAGVSPIDRWRAEGYALDLSGHEDFEPDCEACGCKDVECPLRVHLERENGLRFCGFGGDAEDAKDVAACTCSVCKAKYQEQIPLPGVVTGAIITKPAGSPGYGF